MKSSDKAWSTGEGNGNPLQYFYLEISTDSKKMQKDMTSEDEPSRLEDIQYATGKEQRNSSRRNEETEPKQKPHSVVVVSGGESKVRCSKEQYCIGTWNVRSMNQGKSKVVKHKSEH